MKIQMNTNLLPVFTGTYENIWDISETDNNGNELQVDYKHEDLMKSIAEAYHNKESEIVDDLGIDFIEKIEFLGTFYSPREYNFSTDTLDFDLTVNKRKMLSTLKELQEDEAFNAYLHEKYTSRDGFISFTPNNYTDLVLEITTEGREFDQSIGALIQYLANKSINTEEF